jgi:hypothetical protein
VTEPLKDFDPLDSLTSIYNKNEIEGTFKILGKMLPLWINWTLCYQHLIPKIE